MTIKYWKQLRESLNNFYKVKNNFYRERKKENKHIIKLKHKFVKMLKNLKKILIGKKLLKKLLIYKKNGKDQVMFLEKLMMTMVEI